MNPFLSLRNYEEFVYTLKQRFPSVQGSTLTVVPRGKRMAIVQGEIAFAQGYRITLKERLSSPPCTRYEFHPTQFTGSYSRNRGVAKEMNQIAATIWQQSLPAGI